MFYNFALEYQSIRKMNKIKILFIGGALLLCSLPIMSKAYYLYYSTGVYNGQKGNKGSRVPRRPLCVDYTDKVLTISEQLVGYTLTVVDEEENEFSCFLTSNILVLPSYLVGELEISFTDGNQTFSGVINAE